MVNFPGIQNEKTISPYCAPGVCVCGVGGGGGGGVGGGGGGGGGLKALKGRLVRGVPPMPAIPDPV